MLPVLLLPGKQCEVVCVLQVLQGRSLQGFLSGRAGGFVPFAIQFIQFLALAFLQGASLWLKVEYLGGGKKQAQQELLWFLYLKRLLAAVAFHPCIFCMGTAAVLLGVDFFVASLCSAMFLWLPWGGTSSAEYLSIGQHSYVLTVLQGVLYDHQFFRPIMCLKWDNLRKLQGFPSFPLVMV